MSVILTVIGDLVGGRSSQFNAVVSQHALDDEVAAVARKPTMIGPGQLDGARPPFHSAGLEVERHLHAILATFSMDFGMSAVAAFSSR
jgi:hypothetical protein